jgi:hypothetical protein
MAPTKYEQTVYYKTLSANSREAAAMKFRCTLMQPTPSRWTARHASASMGTVEASAATREQALEKLRNELRYRLELCPCTGEQYQHLQIELEAES